jgi:hypothetical protein
MPDLRDKTILILSPQAWGKMFLAKHHYALELAKRGNKVYFLNPPDQENIRFRDSIVVTQINSSQLFLIKHQLFFPYWLKFKALSIFQLLMKFQIQRILKKLERIDIVWSFDIGHLYPFRFFPSQSYKIYHPVDEPESMESIKSASDANIIFSVTKEILEKYEGFPAEKHLINHGVSSEFLKEVELEPLRTPLHIGSAGNLLRKDIDRATLLSIVNENPAITFDFWGPYEGESNIGGHATEEVIMFINSLRANPNVILHGQVNSNELSKQIQRMDAFLICYDINLDHSKGTNYHKIIEFLSTGKVVISNNVSAYKDRPDLIQMPLSRVNNNELPTLFKKVVSELKFHNLPAKQLQRKMFARENSYEKQIQLIEEAINKKSNEKDVNIT